VYEWALFLHLAGAVLFFAGLAAAALAQRRARGRPRPSETAALLRVARDGVLLVGLGTLLVLGAGFWLLEQRDAGLPGWVAASLTLLAFAVVAGGLGGQAAKRARKLAERLAGEGDEPSAELEALLRHRPSAVLNWAAAAAAVAILVLMVWQP
jgi:uncharacterized membrane protein